MKLKFTVLSLNSNPVPYKRTTQRAKFKDEQYKRYQNWKDKVCLAFRAEFKKPPQMIFEKDTKYYVNIKVYYKNYAHGDTDNVLKGINDAIFQEPLSDKYIASAADFDYDPKNPRVEIEIIKSHKIKKGK